jgi:hypothetical protein
MIKRLARWILRHETASMHAYAEHWKRWAFIQEKYREEVYGEGPDHPGFRRWYLMQSPHNALERH